MLRPVLEHLIFDSHLDLIGRWVWAGAADNNSSHCCRSRRWWTRSWGNVMPIDRRRSLMRTTIITTSGCYFMVNTVRKHISVNVRCHWGQVCVVLQVLRSSTPSSTKALTSATLTLVGCLEQESTLQRIHQRATSMSTASEEGPAVRRTKIGPAISATGNWTSNPSDRSLNEGLMGAYNWTGGIWPHFYDLSGRCCSAESPLASPSCSSVPWKWPTPPQDTILWLGDRV